MTNRSSGYSLLEVVLVILLLIIIMVMAFPNLVAYLNSAHETRALANLRTLRVSQAIFYTQHSRYGVVAELFNQDILPNNQFKRLSSVQDRYGMNPTEYLSDSHYDYSFRYAVNATGYTIDADPKPNLWNRLRFFRYRTSRELGSAHSPLEVTLYAHPKHDHSTPSSTDYRPLNY